MLFHENGLPEDHSHENVMPNLHLLLAHLSGRLKVSYCCCCLICSAHLDTPPVGKAFRSKVVTLPPLYLQLMNVYIFRLKYL